MSPERETVALCIGANRVGLFVVFTWNLLVWTPSLSGYSSPICWAKLSGVHKKTETEFSPRKVLFSTGYSAMNTAHNYDSYEAQRFCTYRLL
jgi:hypothetical protein